MSEQRPEYHTSGDGDLKDAMEMLGTGYEPSLEIHPEITVIRRRGQEMKEEVIPAFVKISTDFKKEMACIDEISLKVWLFIALSVNRVSGKANPGLRTISEGTGFAVNTIQAALIRLEKKYNLLTVDRNKCKYNIYEPLAFVSANKTPPTGGVSADDTVIGTVSVEDKTVSVQPKTVSVGDETVSARVILNQSNQSNQIKPENGFSKEFFEECNKKVDRLLESEGKAQMKKSWRLRELCQDDAIRDLIDVLYQEKRLEPIKSQLMYWIEVVGEWVDNGFQPDDVRAAIRLADEKGYSYNQPSGLTNTIVRVAGARRLMQEKRCTSPREEGVVALVIDPETGRIVTPVPSRIEA